MASVPRPGRRHDSVTRPPRIVLALSAGRAWPAAIVLAAAAAGALSLLMGAGQSTWFDENYSIMICQRSWERMLGLTSVDVHPPLYYVLLKGWASVFGWSLPALRSLSTVFLALTVAVSALLLGRLFGRERAVACLPFLVFAPFALRCGYEIRMYSMMMFFGVAGTYVLVRAVQERRRPVRARWWAAYAVVVAAGMYTQYLMALVWLTHAMLLAVYSWRRRGEGLGVWSWLAADMAAVVLYLPWIPIVVRQIGYDSLPTVKTSLGPSQLTTVYTVLLTGRTAGGISTLFGLPVIAMGVLVLAFAIRAFRGRTWRDVVDSVTGVAAGSADRDSAGGMALLLYLFCAPLALMACVSAVKELSAPGYGFFMMRYMCPFLMFFYAFAGMVFADALCARPAPGGTRRHAGWAATVAWCCALCLMMGGVVSAGLQGNVNYERHSVPAARTIAQNVPCSASTPVIAADAYVYVDSWYDYRDCSGYRVLSGPEIGRTGGYAPLYGSSAQMDGFDKIDAREFTVLIETSELKSGMPARLRPLTEESRYVLARTQDFGLVSALTYRAADR